MSAELDRIIREVHELADRAAALRDRVAALPALAAALPRVAAAPSPSKAGRPIEREAAARAACAATGASRAQVLGDDRSTIPSMTRQIAWWMQRLSGLSDAEIGRQWKRDHTTIRYGAGRISEKIRDPAEQRNPIVRRFCAEALCLAERIDLVPSGWPSSLGAALGAIPSPLVSGEDSSGIR